MWVYFDESGHPHPNDSCTKSVLVAVCIQENSLSTATRSSDLFESAMRRYYKIIEDKKMDFVDESGTMYGFSKLSDQVICGLPETTQLGDMERPARHYESTTLALI